MFEIVTIQDVKMQIGIICKSHRKASDLSRDELSELLDLSRSTIQNIENGKNSTLDNVLKIINHYDLLPQLLTAIKGLKLDDNNSSLY